MPDNEYTNEVLTSEQTDGSRTDAVQAAEIPAAEPGDNFVQPAETAAPAAPGPDISFSRNMLADALNVVDTLNSDREQLKQYNDTRRRLDKDLETLKKNIEKEKNDTVRNRRTDVEAGFDRQIRDIDSEISDINNRRQRARAEGVKARVENNTAGLREEIVSMKAQMKEYLKEKGAPSIFASRLYYTFFSPMNIWDWIIDIIIAAALVGAVIMAYVKRLPLPGFLSVLGCVVAVIAIYVVIASKTKEKYHEEMMTCKNILKGIAEREKTIKAISKNIENDKDDTVYNLGEFDNELQQKNQLKTEVGTQKAEALSQFDNVTRNMILNEIDSKYAADISTLQGEIAQNADAVNTFTSRVTAGENRLNSEFVQYVGTRNLSHDRIEQMIGLIDSGEATSVSEAVSKLK